jgi:hypothetical protein
MGTDSELAKLAGLRAKTDRQLLQLINSRLERGLRLARLHVTVCSNTVNDCQDQHRAKAEGAYAEALKLLPTVYDPDELERRQIESKLDELQTVLSARPRAFSAGC